MAKSKKITEPVFVNSTNLINSMYGGEVYHIEFVGIETQKKYHTYADPANQNWRIWKPIIGLAERKGVVISRDLRLKDARKGLVNADSPAYPELVVSKDDLMDQIEEFWKSQNMFNNLFGPLDEDDDDDADL